MVGSRQRNLNWKEFLQVEMAIRRLFVADQSSCGFPVKCANIRDIRQVNDAANRFKEQKQFGPVHTVQLVDEYNNPYGQIVQRSLQMPKLLNL